jgi:hypothetical protein
MNKGISLAFASSEDDAPSQNWVNLSEKDRINLINSSIDGFQGAENIDITSALANGQVSLVLKIVMTASDRGAFLLDFEEWAKDKIDKGISIWHEPIGDKNSLRNLRGIEVVINEE